MRPILSTSLKVAVIGIGGYASEHHQVFLDLEEEGLVQIIATCDPALAQLQSLVKYFNFSGRGVEVLTDFSQLMDRHGASLDLVVVATPVHFHSTMHAVCASRGIACYVEKPPTLDPAELERMILDDRQAVHATHVGFHYVHQRERRDFKKRCLAGEFGELERLSLLGLSRRNQSYYSRNNWAGCLRVGNRMVLDSCCGNALAHQLNSLLFFAGQGALDTWGSPREVEAELYRANAIEGTDTVFARCRLESGIDLRIAASHACANLSPVITERLDFEKAIVEIRTDGLGTIQHRDGRIESLSMPPASLHDNVRRYLAYLAGRHTRPIVSLKDSRPFVELDALLYVAAPTIHDVPSDCTQVFTVPGESHPSVAIAHLEAVAQRFIRDGIFPSKTNLRWAGAGGTATRHQLDALPRMISALQSARHDSKEACHNVPELAAEMQLEQS
ncbi:Gfo/Idh/MocA family oxidoreductase [soil metagenome]